MAKQILEHSWEYFFNEEALQVEEFLSTHSEKDYEKSRLRIALEQNILSWENYKNWFQSLTAVPTLKENLTPQEIMSLNEKYSQNQNNFSHYTFLSSDIIALENWDGHTIFMGLSYIEQLEKIPNSLFILCSQKNLNRITDTNYSADAVNSTWRKAENNYLEYSLQARKSFDGFATLKINNHFTELFKMDEDLSKENISSDLFRFSLQESNPFSEALKSGKSLSFELNSLNIKILDYTSALIVPLKKGTNTLGFLLGLKTTAINEIDLQTLEEISNRAS